MKNFFMVIGIIVVVLILVFALIFGVGMILVSSEGLEKEPLSVADFQTVLNEKEFTVYDITSQYVEMEHVEKALIARPNNGENFQIEFFDLSDDEKATLMYGNNVATYEAKNSGGMKTNIKGINYNKFESTNNEKYAVICNVEDTLMYLNVDIEFQESVKALIEELGY